MFMFVNSKKTSKMDIAQYLKPVLSRPYPDPRLVNSLLADEKKN